MASCSDDVTLLVCRQPIFEIFTHPTTRQGGFFVYIETFTILDSEHFVKLVLASGLAVDLNN